MPVWIDELRDVMAANYEDVRDRLFAQLPRRRPVAQTTDVGPSRVGAWSPRSCMAPMRDARAARQAGRTDKRGRHGVPSTALLDAIVELAYGARALARDAADRAGGVGEQRSTSCSRCVNDLAETPLDASARLATREPSGARDAPTFTDGSDRVAARLGSRALIER